MVKYLQSQEQERKYISSEPDAVSDDRMNASKYDGMVVQIDGTMFGNWKYNCGDSKYEGTPGNVGVYCTVLYCTVLAMLERDHMASGHDTRAIMI